MEVPTNPANDSKRRRLLEKEYTVTREIHIGLHETGTKYATREKDVFMEKDIIGELIHR